MEYQIRPIGKKCVATGEELVPGTICHSTLVEQNGELVRLDFSPQGWKGPPENAIGVWTCIVPQPAVRRKEPLDVDALFGCFEQLMEDANPAREGLRYVLALLLLKKRRLRLEGSRIDGNEEYLEVASAKGEGSWELRDLHPTEAESAQWQAELNQYLEAEWRYP
jgi:hypothetical protein